MKGMMLRISLLLVVIAFIGGCHGVPILNITDAGITTATGKDVTMDQVKKAILAAATASTPPWLMKVVKPGHILATLHNRRHTAIVDIMYTTKAYSITYNNSTNLKYDPDAEGGPMIHKGYNKWVRFLNSQIQARINAI